LISDAGLSQKLADDSGAAENSSAVYPCRGARSAGRKPRLALNAGFPTASAMTPSSRVDPRRSDAAFTRMR
jgi:hypothetical protein